MSVEYTKTTWVNDITPVNETNMNNIENGIEDVADAVNKVSIINITSAPFSPEENIIYHYVGVTGGTFTFDKFYKYDSGWVEVDFGGYTLPQASSSLLGGIKADTYDSETYTAQVRINPSTGKLYTYPRIVKQESGGGVYVNHEFVINDDYTPTYRRTVSGGETAVYNYKIVHELNYKNYVLMPQEELSSGAELTANKSYYKTLAAHLTGITLSGATSGKLNHWHLVVTNSGGAYTTSFNTTIKWSGALPSFANNKTYEFSIIRVGTSPSFTYLGSWVEYS